MSQSQRRLAAIMFTDMVGYTALGQKNESLSLALAEEQRKLIRPILGRHGGREIKTMGDAFLVEFPSALEAVRCAYDIQRATREFNISLSDEKRVHLRIGVHLGDVTERDGDIEGDAVNVASRIEPLAEDGGVCMSRQIFDHVQNKIEIPLTSLGAKALKNVAAPIEVYKMVMPWERADSLEVPDRRRIAVLPFASLSADPNDEYFADGVTEELISTISRVRGLRVIARTSAMHYKGGTKRVSEIGSELRVGTVLEGSVRKSGEKVRISAQLIDAPSEEHLWAEDYERRIEDVFEIQKDLASRIAGELKIKLVPEEKDVIEKKDTENSAAHTLYLKGRYFWSERSKEGLGKAKEYFERAIQLDPGYARAYSGLSDTYSIMAFQSLLPSGEGTAKARELAEKALELDNTLAEAHTSLAYSIPEDGLYGWKASEEEFKLALHYNPSYATAHFWYSIELLWLRRFDEAVSHAKQAEELDPLSPAISTALGQMLLYSNRVDEAIGHLEGRVLDLPESSPAHFILGMAYYVKGSYEKALEQERLALAGSSMNHRVQTVMAISLYRLGRKDEAMKILDTLTQTGAALSLRAICYVVFGDKEKAIDLLSKAHKDRESSLGWINVVQVYDPIRGDPRFQEIVRGMNLPTG